MKQTLCEVLQGVSFSGFMENRFPNAQLSWNLEVLHKACISTKQLQKQKWESRKKEERKWKKGQKSKSEKIERLKEKQKRNIKEKKPLLKWTWKTLELFSNERTSLCLFLQLCQKWYLFQLKIYCDKLDIVGLMNILCCFSSLSWLQRELRVLTTSQNQVLIAYYLLKCTPFSPSSE